jgi:hypothetical protein
MCAKFVSPSGLMGHDLTYPSAYADGNSYAALRATDVIQMCNFNARERGGNRGPSLARRVSKSTARNASGRGPSNPLGLYFGI